jgi:SP family facilitated glucose transporter-like MFS transporter 2
MVGGVTAKHATDRFGHRGSLLLHHALTALAALCTSLPFYAAAAPAPLLALGRLLHGVQGGLACLLVPSYLHEIAPPGPLRARAPALHSLALALGLLAAQLLAFKQLLGAADRFHLLLLAPLVPAALGAALTAALACDSPRALLDGGGEARARATLRRLRNSSNVNGK